MLRPAILATTLVIPAKAGIQGGGAHGTLDSRFRGNDRKSWAVATVLLLLFLLFAPPAFAQDYPALAGRVVDQADLLTPAQEAEIAAKSEALEKASGRQFVVATIGSLNGGDIESYANGLFRHWQLGDEQRDDGVLLLVAPNEKRVRIEVGYGLEPILTDALSSLIINRQILPRFKDGDMPGGIVAGADEVIEQISLPPAEAAARQQQLLSESQEEENGGLLPFLFIAIWFIVLLCFILPLIFGSSRGRRYRGGRAPVVIWGPSGSSRRSEGGGWSGSSSSSSWDSGSSSSWSSSSSDSFSGGGGSSGGGGASGSW